MSDDLSAPQDRFKVEAEWVVDTQDEAEKLGEGLMLLGAETAGSTPLERPAPKSGTVAWLIDWLTEHAEPHMQVGIQVGINGAEGEYWSGRFGQTMTLDDHVGLRVTEFVSTETDGRGFTLGIKTFRGVVFGSD